MSNTLLICDKQFLSTLYLINLEVYLATKVEVVISPELAIAELKTKKKYDLIITIPLIEKKDSFALILEHIKSYGLKAPLIKVGATEDKDISARVFEIASLYNIQGMLKKSAGLLGVTAKQMSETDVGEYYSIPMSLIGEKKQAPCNIYYTNGNDYKFLIRKSDICNQEHLSLLKEKNITTAFVKSIDRLVLINMASIRLIDEISNALTTSQGQTVDAKIENLSDGYEFAAANLFVDEEVKQGILKIAHTSTKVMADIAKELPSTKALLDILNNNQSGYVFTHSMITSYVAQHIIKHIPWGGEGQTDKINFVLFFHDIYLAPLYLKYPNLQFESEIYNYPKLNDKEKEVILNHARLSAELVVTFKKCPMGADVLIKTHHGMKKGRGFTDSYPEDLSHLTKIILIAESFTEQFIAATGKGQKIDRNEIVKKIILQFGKSSYTAIIESLVNIPL